MGKHVLLVGSVLAVLAAGCSSDSGDSTVPADALSAQVEGLPNGGSTEKVDAGEFDAFTFRLVVTEDSSAESAARYLDARLSSYPGASPAQINGQEITAVVGGISQSEAEAVSFGKELTASFRPVLDSLGPQNQSTLELSLTILETADDPYNEVDDAMVAAAQEFVDHWTLTPDAAVDEVSVLPPADDSVAETRFLLGPSPFLLNQVENPGGRTTGVIVSDATAQQRDTPARWSVLVELRGGSPGADDFNALAATCFNYSVDCPTGRIAIVAGGKVVSAPTVAGVPELREVEISGQFTEEEAAGLAGALLAGNFQLERVQISPYND